MEQRIEFALKALRTLNFRALCQEYGISAKTGYKWKERFLREGLGGMVEESCRPKSSPEQLPEQEVCEIVRLKLAHLSWGARKIRELYLRRHGEVVSESTFKRVLERAGLTQKRRKRGSTQAGRLCSGRRAGAANELWTVDFKGWWRSWGQRCEPLTVRDEYSRYVLEVRALADARSRTVRTNFERLFERHGLPQAIRSDNGSPFARRARALWAEPAVGLVGGFGDGSTWNEAGPVTRRITERMNACMGTSAAKLRPLGNQLRKSWICGDTHLITSGHMRP